MIEITPAEEQQIKPARPEKSTAGGRPFTVGRNGVTFFQSSPTCFLARCDRCSASFKHPHERVLPYIKALPRISFFVPHSHMQCQRTLPSLSFGARPSTVSRPKRCPVRS
jgi:hypothetical protein